MEQVLYAQVVKLRRNDLKFIAANKNKNEAKLKFQGLSAISQRWFDLDFDWIGIRKQWTLILIISNHLKKETKQIQ